MNNIMETSSKKHCQIPYLTKDSILSPIDLIVYAHIKRYMNKETRTALPSILVLTEDSQLDKRTIVASTERLITAELMGVTKKKGYSNLYIFPTLSKDFEMFSDEFIMSPLLTPLEKGI